jgi:tRNA (Thr-GGU) A37 N-methylase
MNEENRRACHECGRTVEAARLFEVDRAVICATCLYGAAEPFEIYPIGTVRNELQRRDTGFGTTGSGGRSRIALFPSQRRFMYRLEEEPYLTVVYYLHKARAVTSVFQRGLDGKKTGLFATRTPDRLSRIGIQDVRLLGIDDTTLRVDGLDAIDGTPILDIKLCRHKPGEG